MPNEVSLGEHRQVSRRRLNLLRAGGRVPPERLILEDPAGTDLEFYNDLPDQFDVFRGSYHDDPARVAAGLSWSLDPEVAGACGNVVTAQVRKDQIGAAYVRFGEIVVLGIVALTVFALFGDDVRRSVVQTSSRRPTLAKRRSASSPSTARPTPTTFLV